MGPERMAVVLDDRRGFNINHLPVTVLEKKWPRALRALRALRASQTCR